MSQDGLPAKALFLSDLLKKIYLHVLVHSLRSGGCSVWELLVRAVVPVLCEQLCSTKKLLRKIPQLDELHLSPWSLCGGYLNILSMFKRENLGAALQGRRFPVHCGQGLFLMCPSLTPEPKHSSGQ